MSHKSCPVLRLLRQRRDARLPHGRMELRLQNARVHRGSQRVLGNLMERHVEYGDHVHLDCHLHGVLRDVHLATHLPQDQEGAADERHRIHADLLDAAVAVHAHVVHVRISLARHERPPVVLAAREA